SQQQTLMVMDVLTTRSRTSGELHTSTAMKATMRAPSLGSGFASPSATVCLRRACVVQERGQLRSLRVRQSALKHVCFYLDARHSCSRLTAVTVIQASAVPTCSSGWANSRETIS